MNLQPREYQQNILASIEKNGNTLVVLPTGLGKTLIALGLMEKLKGKCLFLTPTKPLARQHYHTIFEILGEKEENIALVTGESPPKKRKEMYGKRLLSSTPQTIRNDIKNGLIEPESLSLVVFDEAHRAVGEYAYVKIAEKLPPETLIIALTASPGGDRTKIKEVLNNLKISNIEIRTSEDPDVAPYMKKMDTNWIPVELGPEYQKAKGHLSKYIHKQADALKHMGINPPLTSKRAFIEQRQKIFKITHPMKFRAIYLSTCLLHSLHILELLETQGKEPVIKYLEKLSKSESKAALATLRSPELQEMLRLVKESADHPKMAKLLSLVKDLGPKKMIIFVQYRDQIESIMAQLTKAGFPARPFMGKRENFTKKMQEETMDAFRKGEFSILVASSIGEEGLDIPAVDAVIFFEPIPSEIRTIQRRGRAGRFKEGAVYILMTRNTRDEYYYWASRKREKKMKEILISLQKEMREQSTKQTPRQTKPNPAQAKEEETAGKRERAEKTEKEALPLPTKQGQNRITDFLS